MQKTISLHQVRYVLLRLFIFILFTCYACLMTANASSQGITLKAENIKVSEILKHIENNTTYHFLKGKSTNINEIYLKVDVVNMEVPELLNGIEKKAPLRFSINGNMISVTLKEAPAPIIIVSGTVVDEVTAEPLQGVNIRIGKERITTNSKGQFSVNLPPGRYTAELSHAGYQSKRIEDIDVVSGQPAELSFTMSRVDKVMENVVVTSSMKKESTASLLSRQRTTAEISNGISREQIAALPDKNVGETLKRISGISTNDNKRVVVRGIAERYNVAMMDGATLPSTDVQTRDFEFDIIPSNLIENVIVSKAYTPDMGFGFGGGLIQINTMAVPNRNFTTLSIGGKYTKGSTGKDFLGYGRGKNDYLGFDDGSRNHFPTGLFEPTNPYRYDPRNPYKNVVPKGSNLTPITPEMIAEQNRRIGGTERLGTRIYKTLPSQNYQFSLGRSYGIKKSRLGFVGSLSYRNEQNIDDISEYQRGDWWRFSSQLFDTATHKLINPTTARQYNFNTTLAGLLNAGWSTRNHSITLRNFYSRVFSNQFFRIAGQGEDIGGYGAKYPAVREYDRPKFIDLLQNKLSGEHTFGKFDFAWSLGRNHINNLELDAVDAWLFPVASLNDTIYNYMPGLSTDGGRTLTRGKYQYKEENRMADAALTYNFDIGNLKHKVKIGYQYLGKKGDYGWTITPLGSATAYASSSKLQYIPIQQWTPYLDFKDPLTDLYYYPYDFSLNKYEGKNNNQAYFVMLDNRITNWARLVWGFRGEYYKYEKIKDGATDSRGNQLALLSDKIKYIDPENGNLVHRTLDAAAEDKAWQYMPMAALTLTPLKNFNVRLSYAKSAVRPALIENSSSSRYNYQVGRIQRNTGLVSTLITHWDGRIEWYPGAGEVISVGYFKKYFKNPTELYLTIMTTSGEIDLLTGNSDWADVKGWEFDMRKSLGFIYPSSKILKNIFFSGNLTLQNSEVQASSFLYESFGGGNNKDKYDIAYSYRTKTLLKEKRPLYGQVPVLYNIGLQYAGDRLGANIAFNHMGYKVFTVGMRPEFSERERPRDQVDAQLSYKFLKNKKLDVKLNISNLTNSPYRFYINSTNTYKLKPGMEKVYNEPEWSQRYEWKYGFSDKYEEGYYEPSADGKNKIRIGDTDTFIRRVGTSFSLSASYNF